MDIRQRWSSIRRIAKLLSSGGINWKGDLYRIIRYKPRVDQIYNINPVRYEKYDVI